ncbi:MAG: hypothetical protein PHY73_05805 [Candidatus Omnitrophica bacterium]|nr:hypothetical protein [Candidatus Omnitrophota bacterium]
MKNKIKIILPYLGIFALLALCYNTVFRYDYAHHDELNFFLYGKKFIIHSVKDFVLAMGRFIGAYIATSLNYLVNSLDGLKVARFFMVVQLFVAASILMCWFKNNFLSKRDAFILSVLIFTLPSFEIMASFAAGFNNSTALWVGLLSGIWAHKIPIAGNFLSRLRTREFVVSVVLFIAALMVYQPSAVIFWVIPAFLILFSSLSDFENTKQRLINFFVAGFGSLGFYFVILQSVKGNLMQLEGAYNPYHVTTDYFGKIQWFFSEVFVVCLNFWNVFPKKDYALFWGGFIFTLALGVFLWRIQKARKDKNLKEVGAKIALLTCIFFVLLLLSFLPNLLSSGNSSFYRCLSGPTTIVLGVMIWLIWCWTKIIKKHQKNVFTFILMGLMIFGLLKACKNVFRYIVYPGFIQVDVMKSVLRNNFYEYDRVHIIHSEKDKLQAYQDEFGFLSANLIQNRLGLVFCGYIETLKEDLNVLGIFFDYEKQEAEYLFTYKNDSKRGFAFKKVISSSLAGEPLLFDQPTIVVDMTRLYNPGGPLEYLKLPTKN